MDRFNALGRGMQIMLVGAVLLFIDLFLPWQDFGNVLGVDVTFSGWRGVGVILGILAIIVVAWIALRLAAVDLRLPVSSGLIAAALGVLTLAFGIIKWLTIIDDEATFWAWIGLLLAIAVAVGAWLTVQAAGGMGTLRTEMESMQAASPAPAAPQAPPPPQEQAAPPPPAAEPAAPPPPPPAAPEPPPAEEPPMAPPESTPPSSEEEQR